VIGTPIYMAPEQFKTSHLDHRADSYALGASVYHALSGKLPFDDPSIWEMMLSKTRGSPRLAPPVSNDSAELVAAMMAVDPAARPGSYEELIARIDALECLRGVDRATPSDVMRSLPAPPGNKWPLLAAAGAALLLAAAGVGFVLLGRGGTTSTAATTPTTARYDSTGVSVQLYDTRSIQDWQGDGWSLDDDEEKNRVLTGQGKVRRTYEAGRHFRVTLGVDLNKANHLELWFIIPESPQADRTVLRITRDGDIVLGTRAGDNGSFTATGKTYPYPSKEQLTGKGSYREMVFEKVGDVWRASFGGQTVGTVRDDGTPKLLQFWLFAEGGPIRILSAGLEELVEAK
jgi:hypothetical protein